QAMKNRRLQGYEPVEVDGGWALRPTEQPTQAEGKPAAKPKQEKAKTQRAAQRASEPREMEYDGGYWRPKDRKPLLPGDVFRTSSGRVTTPYPKQKRERFHSQWLIDNAVAEAEARGDKFNAKIFRATTIFKDGTMATGDYDALNEYLFGQQPPVVPSILKPLSAKRGAEERTQKGEESTKQQVARTEQEAPLDEQPATQTQAEETEEKTAVTEPSDGVVPHFETYDDANDWIERRAKELGISRRAFGSTDEYKAIYPQIEAL